jgi:hypothetical protein
MAIAAFYFEAVGCSLRIFYNLEKNTGSQYLKPAN